MSQLTGERVTAVFMDCLFQNDEDTSTHVEAVGITSVVRFHPGRLESHRAEIVALLDKLPAEFHEKAGGSFLNACNDRHGNQWADFHETVEQLFLLGLGIGKARSPIPREMWSVLPGGMPYYVVTD